jgi:hypothetical protein
MIDERTDLDRLKALPALKPDPDRGDKVRERCRARFERPRLLSWVTIWPRRRGANGSCAVVADPDRVVGRVRVHRQLHHSHGDPVA